MNNHRFSTLTKAIFSFLPAMVLSVSLPCKANVPTPATPPPPPAGYCQTINTELTNDLNAFNTNLRQVWNGTTFPVLYAGNLPSADGNVGPHLTDSSHFLGVQNQLLELQAMGYKAVMIEVGFPVLYEPFYSSQSQYLQYVGFYAQVAATIRAMGMKIIVENDVLLSNDTQAGWTNTAQFFSTLSWSQYIAARAQMAATVAQVIQPDYLVLGEEPDSESFQAAQPNVNNPVDAAAMISGEIAAVQALNMPIKVGAGFGSWTANLSQYISNYVALPLDYIDFHVYPINTENGQSLIGNALTIASAAAAAGKPVAMSETWLWKMEDSEWLKLTPDQYRAREAFSFWAPENTLFLQTMQNLANYTQMLYQAPSEPMYFWAYQTYGGTTANGGAANCTCTTASCNGTTIINTETTVAQTANMQAAYTSTGLGYYNLLVTTPDTTAPSIPTNLAGNAISTTVGLSWTPSSDDIGVAGYNVIRNGVWIANTTQPAYSDTGLSTSTTYNYQVQAFDLAGNTSVMTPTLAMSTVYTLPPSVPANVVAMATSTSQVAVSWTASTDPQGVSSYQILRGTTPNNLVQIGIVNGTTTNYNDRNLNASTTYYYGITATQAAYVSQMSGVAIATTLALPTAPTGVTAAATSTSQVAVSWSAGPSGMPVSSYQILRGTTSTNLVKVATRTTLSYTDMSLTAGTTYYYAVTETDTAGNVSPMSTVVAATTLAPPSAPTGVTAVANTHTRTTVSWNPGPSGMTIGSYQIYRGTTPSNMPLVATRTTTSYTDSTVSPNTTYYYAITETDTGGNVSPMSATASVTTPN
jgi:fibronectin type 3 domain-containing protein